MSRKRLITFVLPALVALVAASVAVAHARRAQSTSAAAATFAATSVSHSKSSTCTGADGTYQNTVARYDGTASSSDGRLNGPLTISAHSVVNTSTGLGWVDGSYRVRGSSGGAHGSFHAAVASGKAAGALTGSVGGPQGKLVASLAATFSQTGGFSDGAVGTGTVSGAGVVFQNGACTKTKPPKPPHTVSVARLDFRPGHHRAAAGSLTLDVTRDSNGAVTGANAVFYVNYRFGQSVTISGLTVKQEVKGGTDPVVIDAGTGSISDGDGSGNLTKQVGVSGATAEALLAHPRGYYAELTTSLGTLRANIGGFGRR